MPITLTPHDNDNTVLIYHCQGNWTWDEFGRVDHSVWRLFHQKDTRIDLIFDLSQSNSMPMGISQIVHQVGQRSPRPTKDVGVFIQAPLSLQIVVRALKRIYPNTTRQYHFVQTFDEAITLIQQDRMS